MERGGKLQSNNHVIASFCSLTPPPPVTAGRRAAAAGKKHPARRRRLIKTGEDYYMQVCTSLQTYNHASTPPLSFFTGRTPFLPPNQQRQSTEGKTNQRQQNPLRQFRHIKPSTNYQAL